MKTVSFIAEMGNLGADGTTINLAGLGLPERTVKLLANFDVSKLISQCVVSKTPQGLLVEAAVPDELLEAYPAIGVKVNHSVPNERGGRTITSCTLGSVSLSFTPNADPNIMRLSEQQIKDAPRLLDSLKNA